MAREHTTNSSVNARSTTLITEPAPRRISSGWSTAIRLGAGAALIAIALVWPFLSITSRAPGPPLTDFGGGHGIDPVDFLSLPLFAAAVIMCLPIMRRRTKRPREDEPNRSN